MGFRKLIHQCVSKIWHLNAVRIFIPARLYCALEYKHRMGKRINLKTPKTFNEKLQWLKLYDKNPSYTKLVDKFEVRKYIEKTIGEQYLIPLIGIYSDVDDIPFEDLPEQYVLKCTHDSGTVIIRRKGCKLTDDEIKKKLKNALKRNYYYQHREWPYKNVKARIICEEYMENATAGELIDYKFMCFHGEPKCLFLCLDRHNGKGLKVDFYDMDWNLLPFERHYPQSGRLTPKPDCFTLMVELARKLANNLTFVRVDLFEVNGKIYFGELTFYPGNGTEEFTPEVYDKLLGEWMELPQKGRKQ